MLVKATLYKFFMLTFLKLTIKPYFLVVSLFNLSVKKVKANPKLLFFLIIIVPNATNFQSHQSICTGEEEFYRVFFTMNGRGSRIGQVTWIVLTFSFLSLPEAVYENSLRLAQWLLGRLKIAQGQC